ncbi:ABC transporter ATP-binding protein [Desulfovirgula thermocuniculi]|uniref:ABC transporter ATP-binding protein n=1 Tax=Desulfovirgula thermocuniculi TaxID=348842 RepID=UPI0003FAEF67|nr:ABC transporter ATP-binding protein [Desulfovirgula thermocuniculi]
MLRVENLAVSYGRSQVLFDVSLAVEKGEFVTVIGANGAGKTTLMKAIMGLLRPFQGRIVFRGEDITARPPWYRAELGIGYVPEGRRVFPDLTVEENLRIGAWRRAASFKRSCERIFTIFPRLAERRHQLSKTLSGGEQQMLAIARALVLEPELLLVDEVSMGLMPLLVNRSFKVLRELNREGVTVLLVEQNARLALRAAHRGYVLETGRIVLSGPAAELSANEMVKKAYLGG